MSVEAASRRRRSRARSRGPKPPHTPYGSSVDIAYSKHALRAGHAEQIAIARRNGTVFVSAYQSAVASS